MIDIGVNLTDKSFQNDIDSVIKNANNVGVSHLLVTGTHVASTEKAIELCTAYPEQLRCTAGVHPHHASDWNTQTAARIDTLLQHPSVVACGEMGLDFNRDFSPRPQQELAFAAQLELAATHQKCVFLHERDAFTQQYALLKNTLQTLSNGVIHCFTGDKDSLKAYLDLGLYIGITGWICDERRGQDLQRIVSYIPDDRLLLETDAPYLLPRSLDKQERPKNRRNEPRFLPHIAETIATLRQQTLEDLIAHSRANSIRCFNLDVA